MEWLPPLELGWLNGWLMLAAFYVAFVVLMLLFPRAVVARLYDRSGWSRPQRLLNSLAKVFLLGYTVILVLAPLKFGQAVFAAGMLVFLLGFAGMMVALLDYRNTPLDKPVTQGFYRISRHPQWVSWATMMLGTCLAIGSWAALLLLVITAIFYHFRILAEEQVCVDRYGEVYRSYLKSAPRYLLFF